VLASVTAGLIDEGRETVQVGLREVGVVQQRCSGAERRALVERLDQVLQRALASLRSFYGGEVDVAWAVFLVRGVALLLQNAEVGADRRVARRVIQRFANIGGGGAAEAVENVEHFALAAGEGGRGRHALLIF